MTNFAFPKDILSILVDKVSLFNYELVVRNWA